MKNKSTGIGAAVVAAVGGVVAAAVLVFGGYGGNTSNSGAPTVPLVVSDCRDLVDAAGNEALALGHLKTSVSVSESAQPVTHRKSGYKKYYNQATAGIQAISRDRKRYQEEGGKITADPKLSGDLNQMGIDMPHLNEAVSNGGDGSSERNQLTDYATDFRELSSMRCPS